jgi:hypothetical protein
VRSAGAPIPVELDAVVVLAGPGVHTRKAEYSCEERDLARDSRFSLDFHPQV